MSQLPISFEDIAAAHGRISAVAQRTPVLTSRMVNVLTGAQVFFYAKTSSVQAPSSFAVPTMPCCSLMLNNVSAVWLLFLRVIMRKA